MRRNRGVRRARSRAGGKKGGLGGLVVATLGLAPLLLASGAMAQQRQMFPDLPDRPATQPINPKGEFLLRADEITYDRNNEIVTAIGNVEISQGDRVIMADTISYNRRTEVVTASGNLVWMEPTGDVLFGEYAEIKDDLREGLVREFRALLVDNSRLAANTARRVDGNRKEMSRAVFSPCNLCKEDPTRAPLWQLKGRRVTHDETTHDMEYRDATLEMWGVPVFYLPYFSHPDPTVDRRSGFLAPSFGTSSDLGVSFGLPYYGILDESADFTVEPRVYAKEGLLGAGEVRKRFANGSVRMAGSLIYGREVDGTSVDDERSWRGNLAGEGRWDINDDWRAGFDIARVSDRTYLRRFRIGSDYAAKGLYSIPNQLTSDAWVEGFMGRSYAQASMFAFQSLRSVDRRENIAKVHPFASYQFISGTDRLGGHFQVDTNVLSLSRDEGADSNRLSTNTAYKLPFATNSGHLFTLTASFRADAYAVNDVNLGGPDLYDGSTGRLSPQIAIDWRYPLMRRFQESSLIVEPRVQLVASTVGGNPNKIPNEDSTGFEFDDTNLFSLRRFAGYDRIDTGQRVDYGVGATWYHGGGGSVGGFLGQSLRAQKDGTYGPNSGLEDNFSDIVGRISIRPQQWVDLSYRFRFDHDGLKARREELGATLFRWGGALSVSYINFDSRASDTATKLNPAEQIDLAGVIPLFDYWSVFGQYTYDLDRKESVKTRFGVGYRDECFGFMLTVEQDNIDDREIDDEFAVLFRIGFKYLGDFGGG